jgi:PAS domain S-box-containing protein
MLKDNNFDGPIVEWLDRYSQRGYLATDSSLVICGWNSWLEHKSGMSAQEVIGKPLFDVFPDLVCRQLDRLYHEALKGQTSVLAQRFHRYLLKFPASPDYGLSEMQQTALISPLLRAGEVVGTISAIDDVSERVVRENELMAAREEANKANEAKDRFIAFLSHDLRTPLTAILGWTRIFQERAVDEGMVRKGAEVIERSATIQLALIENLLDISRINADKLELQIESVDIQHVIVSTVETLEPLAQSKGIRIDRIVNLPEPHTAEVDPKRFPQIIWNLISNALKFTPSGGSVRVAVENTGDGFEMRISDTGQGISAENLPHLFEPLWQAQETNRQGGLGLGLAIVKNLVDLHGGSIRAESPGLDQGSVFIVRLPWSGPRGNREGVFLQTNSQRG